MVYLLQVFGCGFVCELATGLSPETAVDHESSTLATYWLSNGTRIALTNHSIRHLCEHAATAFTLQE